MSEKQDKPNPVTKMYVKDNPKQTMLEFVNECLGLFEKRNDKKCATHMECSVSDGPFTIAGVTVQYRKYVRPGNIYLWREEPKQVEE